MCEWVGRTGSTHGAECGDAVPTGPAARAREAEGLQVRNCFENPGGIFGVFLRTASIFENRPVFCEKRLFLQK